MATTTYPGCTACCGGITTTCCPSNPVPSTVHMTITGGGAVNGTYAVSYDVLIGQWENAAAVGTCPTGSIGLRCFSGVWNLTTPTSYAAASSSCSPFQVVFTGVNFTGCGGGTGATVTITP